MSKLKVEALQGANALTDLRLEWQTLYLNSSASLFLGWEWIATWHKWFGKGITPYIICVRERETLIGVLALGRETFSVIPFGPKATKLNFLGEGIGGADYLDILSASGREQDCAGAIFDFLLKSREFELLDLDGLPTDSALLPMSSSRCWDKADFVYKLSPRYACPQVNLEAGWEETLRRSRRADNFKRRLRSLRARDGFAFRTITSPDEIPDAFDRFLHLHDACWAHRGGSGATGTETKREFQREVVQQMSLANRVRFDELWVEGKCRASIYGMDNGRTYYFFLSGYDLEWASQSVGLVLLGLSIEDAVSRGIRVYDFLRGAEPYKFDWANHSRMTAAIRIAANNRLARLAIAHNYIGDGLRAGTPRRIKNSIRTMRSLLGRTDHTSSPAGESAPDETVTEASNKPQAVVAEA